MTEDHSALLTPLTELHDTTENDRTRRITEDALQKLVVPRKREVPPAEAAAAIGAGRYERTDEHTALQTAPSPSPSRPRLGT